MTSSGFAARGARCARATLRLAVPAALFSIALPLVAACHTIEPTTIHVSLNGDDGNPGTEDAPLASWQAAVDRAGPGDTILIEPGVYRVSGARQSGVRLAKGGTEGAPVTLRGDGGLAVLDCSGLENGSITYCLHLLSNWWRISNIAVTGARQNTDGAWAVGLLIEDASNNVLEGVQSFENQGPGILITGRSASNVVTDCRSFANYDARSRVRGGNADGIQVSSLPAQGTGNVLRRCLSHSNSDDGFDLWESEAVVTIEGSTAYRNGYTPGTNTPAGDGSGFKLGRNQSGPLHQIVGNIAYENRGFGFDRNGAAAPSNLVANQSYNNSAGDWK